MKRAGVDIGGTWLRGCVLDPAAGRLLFFRRPAPAPEAWRRTLDPILAKSGLQSLTVGSTGVWTPAQRLRARARLKGLARAVRAVSDLELAHAGAFAGGSGVLVLSGTGSVSLARSRGGALRRAGGWGPILGDEGSAFWIGKRALGDPGLRRTLRLPSALDLAHADFPVRRVAALARVVLKAAPENPRAARLAREAAGKLADLAVEAAEGLFPGRAPVPVSWHGGVLEIPFLRRLFASALRRRFPRADLRPPLMNPDLAGALLV